MDVAKKFKLNLMLSVDPITLQESLAEKKNVRVSQTSKQRHASGFFQACSA